MDCNIKENWIMIVKHILTVGVHSCGLSIKQLNGVRGGMGLIWNLIGHPKTLATTSVGDR